MGAISAEESVVTPLDTVRQQRIDVQLRQLEFHALLHRKLNLDRLFECLLAEGQSFIAFDGVQYLAEERGCNMLFGAVRQYRQRFELKLGERSLGDVVLMRGQPFTAREEREAERLVAGLIYPLDNALEHYTVVQHSLTDPVTGLRNQRALDDQLPREIRLAQRTGQALTIMLVSVDSLQSLATRHGREVCEQAWLSVADSLKLRLRQSDLIFRTVHDGFCLVLSDTELDGGVALAGRLQQDVNRSLSVGNVQFVLSATIGLTELDETDVASILLERANNALESAREAGREQVRAFAAPGTGNGGGPTAA